MRKKRHLAPMPGVAEPVDVEAVEEIRQRAIRDIFEALQPSAETFAAIIGEIENLPTIAVARAVLSLKRDGSDRAVELLEQLVQSRKTAVALAAVEALGAIHTQHAAEVLARVAGADPNKDLRKEAKRALFKLRSFGMAVEAPVAVPEAARPAYPILRSMLSSFDGMGTRAAVFAIERPFGGADRIVCLINSRHGLTHCAGRDLTRKALLEDLDELLKRSVRGTLWAEAPASYCQQLVQEALALNPRSGTAVPRGYFHWKDEIGQPPDRYDRPLVYREISPLEIKWDPTLLEKSGDLLGLPEFGGWAFDRDDVEEYYFDFHRQERSIIALPGWSRKEREEAVLRRFYEERMGPETHASYKRQMEETAYLFLRHERRLDARRTLAVAVAMNEFRGGELIKIPFLRELLLESFALIERELRGETRIGPRALGLITPDQFLR